MARWGRGAGAAWSTGNFVGLNAAAGGQGGNARAVASASLHYSSGCRSCGAGCGACRCPLMPGAEGDHAGCMLAGPMLRRPQQTALDSFSVCFLLLIGVDFNNMEGC